MSDVSVEERYIIAKDNLNGKYFYPQEYLRDNGLYSVKETLRLLKVLSRLCVGRKYRSAISMQRQLKKKLGKYISDDWKVSKLDWLKLFDYGYFSSRNLEFNRFEHDYNLVENYERNHTYEDAAKKVMPKRKKIVAKQEHKYGY